MCVFTFYLYFFFGDVSVQSLVHLNLVHVSYYPVVGGFFFFFILDTSSLSGYVCVVGLFFRAISSIP